MLIEENFKFTNTNMKIIQQDNGEQLIKLKLKKW